MNKLSNSNSLVRRLGVWLDSLTQPRSDTLAMLDDRGLRDIGLTRSEILSVRAEFSQSPVSDPGRVIQAIARTGPLA
jgi:uncharacterized protein YjiS (DUF1127 family)